MVSSARALVFGVALAASTPAMAFDPWGVWVRAESGTVFDFYNCAGKLCAKIVSVAKQDERNAIGTVILRNAARDAEGVWRGDIFNTEDGKIYSGAVTVDKANVLTLEGCLMRYLCKSEKWDRASDQTRAATPGGKPALPAPSPKPGLGH